MNNARAVKQSGNMKIKINTIQATIVSVIFFLTVSTDHLSTTLPLNEKYFRMFKHNSMCFVRLFLIDFLDISIRPTSAMVNNWLIT